MKLSIVATLYQSDRYIEEFYARATSSAKKIADKNYEIVLVNDGSTDNGLRHAIELAKNDSHLVVVDLSKNFGHHKAMMAGLQHARGEYVFLIDSDLEEEPEWLIEFSEKMEKEQCDAVYGVQKTRKGGLFERFSGWLFYKLFNRLTGINYPENAVTARLMKRRYVDALLLHQEREVSLGGLFVLTGFDQCAMFVQKHHTSETTYNFGRKLTVMIDSITSFSNRPLVGIFYVGLLITILASLYVGYLILNRIYFSTPLTGWTSVMASIWLLGGMVILFIGVVGIYLSKVFSETKQRPNTIVREVYTSRKN